MNRTRIMIVAERAITKALESASAEMVGRFVRLNPHVGSLRRREGRVDGVCIDSQGRLRFLVNVYRRDRPNEFLDGTSAPEASCYRLPEDFELLTQRGL